MICLFMKYRVRCITITKSYKVYMIMNRYALYYVLILSNTTMVTYGCIHMELYSCIRYLDFKRIRHENCVRMLPRHTVLLGIWTSKESDMSTNNVLKIGSVIEPEKLLIQGLGAESIIEPQSNRIKSGPKRSLVDSPTDSIRFLKHCSPIIPTRTSSLLEIMEPPNIPNNYLPLHDF